MAPTPEQVALVNRNLPSAAKQAVEDGGYGWTDLFISTLMEEMSFGPAEAVRHFWLERVNETAEYLDMGKPLTQIHRQARDMLLYWDSVLKENPVDMVPVPARKPISFGEIERPWDR